MEKELDEIRNKIFDIMTAKLNGKPQDSDQFLAALPHAIQVLKLLDKLKQLERPQKTVILNADPVQKCIEYLFNKKVRMDLAEYILKTEYIKLAFEQLDDNGKVAEHMGVSLTTVGEWKRKIK